MSKTKEIDKIVCPNCGREYLPAEIYLPNEFMGKPYDIMRDENGKIIGYSGKTMNLKENYICDGCNKPFVVYARFDFLANVDKKRDFDEEYTVTLDNKYSLLED